MGVIYKKAIIRTVLAVLYEYIKEGGYVLEFILPLFDIINFAPQETLEMVVDAISTDTSPLETAISIPLVLEYGAVVTGALSGAMTAVANKLDLLGTAALGIVTGLGGGLIRDIILPTQSVYLLDNPWSMVVCILVSICAFFFSGLFYKLDKPIAIFDIISVGLFTFVGADKAIMCGYGAIVGVLLGLITAVGGGMMRDICLARIPSIFRSGNYYAICSLAGACAYILLLNVGCTKVFSAVICFIVVVTLRWVSIRYNLITVTPIDLTPKITGPIRRLILRSKQKKSK